MSEETEAKEAALDRVAYQIIMLTIADVHPALIVGRYHIGMDKQAVATVDLSFLKPADAEEVVRRIRSACASVDQMCKAADDEP